MRRLIHVLHRWTGLVLGPLLVLQALTGLGWTFQEPLTALFHPQARVISGPPASFDRILAAIAAQYPDGQLDRVQFPHDKSLALTARVKRQNATHILLVHPSTTQILASGPLWRFPEQLAERLHGSLLMGRTGHLILRIEGIALALLAGSGLFLWWPGLARAGRALTIHLRAPWPRPLREVHRVVGALAAALLIVVGITGTLIASEPMVRALVASVAPIGPEVDLDLPPIAAGAPLISAHEALEILQARFTGESLVKARAEGTEGRVIIAAFLDGDNDRPMAYDMAALDRANGALTVLTTARGQPRGDEIIAWLAPVHSGAVLGPLRWLFALGVTLALIAIALTGLALWVTRQRDAIRAGRSSK